MSIVRPVQCQVQGICSEPLNGLLITLLLLLWLVIGHYGHQTDVTDLLTGSRLVRHMICVLDNSEIYELLKNFYTFIEITSNAVSRRVVLFSQTYLGGELDNVASGRQ